MSFYQSQVIHMTSSLVIASALNYFLCWSSSMKLYWAPISLRCLSRKYYWHLSAKQNQAWLVTTKATLWHTGMGSHSNYSHFIWTQERRLWLDACLPTLTLTTWGSHSNYSHFILKQERRLWLDAWLITLSTHTSTLTSWGTTAATSFCH